MELVRRKLSFTFIFPYFCFPFQPTSNLIFSSCLVLTMEAKTKQIYFLHSSNGDILKPAKLDKKKKMTKLEMTLMNQFIFLTNWLDILLS